MYSIKAHAKVNIFLKITGHKDGFHTLLSRFVKVDSLYDTITFEPCKCESFTIEGCNDIPKKSNTIYKAFIALNRHIDNPILIHFFLNHKVVVKKQIPSQAGLGGGSSDAAAFMRLANDICGLKIDTPTLAHISSSIGSDLPFFIYDYPSANIKGFGEIVEPFFESPLDIELHTPSDIGCDTALVYKTFKKELLADIDLHSFDGWEGIDSKTIIQKIQEPARLNDLYQAALIAYPKLQEHQREGWFFSGSGSTFFRIKG